jgi:hypothetical protein
VLGQYSARTVFRLNPVKGLKDAEEVVSKPVQNLEVRRCHARNGWGALCSF